MIELHFPLSRKAFVNKNHSQNNTFCNTNCNDATTSTSEYTINSNVNNFTLFLSLFSLLSLQRCKKVVELRKESMVKTKLYKSSTQGCKRLFQTKKGEKEIKLSHHPSMSPSSKSHCTPIPFLYPLLSSEAIYIDERSSNRQFGLARTNPRFSWVGSPIPVHTIRERLGAFCSSQIM